MNNNKITIMRDGKEIECNILFTHHSDEFNKDYVIFELDESFTAACYNSTGSGEGVLSDIESDEEWALIEELINDFNDDLEDDEE